MLFLIPKKKLINHIRQDRKKEEAKNPLTLKLSILFCNAEIFCLIVAIL